jgi:protease-4
MALCVMTFASGCSITHTHVIGGSSKLEEITLEEFDGGGANKIVMIDITGMIANGGRNNVVARVRDRLARAGKDAAVVGVILRLNTPGGTVTASDILFDEIINFRKLYEKPVVALQMDVCASGGYYISAACNAIVAHRTTITGSIGVIMNLTDTQQLMSNVGLRSRVFKSGASKDAGSPHRDMTEEEAARFQSMIDRMYARFREVVLIGRPKLTPATLDPVADGRVLMADEALAAGLIDATGGAPDALGIIWKLAGVKAANIVTYGTESMRQGANFYSTTDLADESITTMVQDAVGIEPAGTLFYVWAP